MGRWKFVQCLGFMLAFMAAHPAMANTVIEGVTPASTVATTTATPADPGLDEKIRQLEKTVEALVLKAEQDPPWWLPVASSAALAAVLAYVVGHFTARRERSLTLMHRNFTRNELPAFEALLHENLSKHDKELDDTLLVVENTLTSYLLLPSSDLKTEAWRNFDEDAWVKALTSMELSLSPMQPPKSGGRLTWKLEGMLAEYQNSVASLNALLRRFSVSSRIGTHFVQPDGDVVATYRQRRLDEGGFRFSTEVVDSAEFQQQIRDLKSKIEGQAEAIRKRQRDLFQEMKDIKGIALEA
jgi:hypothetical protein